MAEITMQDDKWISLDEAAEYLGVKPITVREWIRKARTPIPLCCPCAVVPTVGIHRCRTVNLCSPCYYYAHRSSTGAGC